MDISIRVTDSGNVFGRESFRPSGDKSIRVNAITKLRINGTRGIGFSNVSGTTGARYNDARLDRKYRDSLNYYA